MREKLYTVREASQFLGITERDVIDLSQQGTLTAYKVGGVYLRFKKEHLQTVKDKVRPTPEEDDVSYDFKEKLSDFFYYNDFYIFSFLVVGILVYLIINL